MAAGFEDQIYKSADVCGLFMKDVAEGEIYKIIELPELLRRGRPQSSPRV